MSEHVGLDTAVKAQETPKRVSPGSGTTGGHFISLTKENSMGGGAGPVAGGSQDRVQIPAPGHDPDPR